MADNGESFQSRFHRRWRHLNDPHVRSLAWLIDAPDLLDPKASQWQGKIASLGPDAGDEAAEWLSALDCDPAVLHSFLDTQPFTRLGRYAEKLMAFYFRHRGILAAHGVQVRNGKDETLGEFDFLLQRDEGLTHWEFATKLYLLESGGRGAEVDYFVGPNLADTLGVKMRKILERQLALGSHPAAQSCLPQAVVSAQALVKGWLFYRGGVEPPVEAIGVTSDHCRGFWCALGELDVSASRHYAILQRLRWLPPLKTTEKETLTGAQLSDALAEHFSNDRMPALIALLEEEGESLLETRRGFIVPGDWRARAEYRIGKR